MCSSQRPDSSATPWRSATADDKRRLRFDHSRAISQDLPCSTRRDAKPGPRSSGGRHALHVERVVAASRDDDQADGRRPNDAARQLRTLHQGVLTGELAPFHPAARRRPRWPSTRRQATTRRSSPPSIRKNLRLDPERARPERTSTRSASIGSSAFIRGGDVPTSKAGGNFIGWTDVGGVIGRRAHAAEWPQRAGVRARQLARRSAIPADQPGDTRSRTTGRARRGKTSVARLAGVWSYTFSTYVRAAGFERGTAAARRSAHRRQSLPHFGQDPNSLTNARGLPNDRPHMFRVMGSADVPRTGIGGRREPAAPDRQALGGRSAGAASQGDHGSCSSRAARGDCRRRRSLTCACRGPIHGPATGWSCSWNLQPAQDTAEESLANDILFSANFGRPERFVDPRRVMLAVRLNLGGSP